MNFIFGGNRTDAESGIPESVPERLVMRSRQPPVVGSCLMTDVNSMGFIATSMFIYMMVYSTPASTNFLTGLGIVALVTITVLKIYVICHEFLGLGNALADGDREFQLNVPPSIMTGGRLQRLRLQLDLVDQEIDDYGVALLISGSAYFMGLDFLAEAHRQMAGILHICAAFHIMKKLTFFFGLTDQELNALLVLQYRIPSDHPSLVDPQSGSSSLHQESSSMQDQASSSTSMTSTIVIEKKDSPFKKYGADELTCSICLEDVESGELVHHLPCLHQFHVGCIDMWLRQKAVCPICKSFARYYTAPTEEWRVWMCKALNFSRAKLTLGDPNRLFGRPH